VFLCTYYHNEENKGVQCAGHVTRLGKTAHSCLVGKREGKKTPGRSRYK